MSSDPEFINNGFVRYSNDRILKNTRSAIRDKHVNLNADDRRYFETLPAIAIPEFQNRQAGWFVKITNIEVVTGGYNVHFKKEKSLTSVPFHIIEKQTSRLGFERGYTNKHHLALRDIDIYSVLSAPKPFRLRFTKTLSELSRFLNYPIWKSFTNFWAAMLIIISFFFWLFTSTFGAYSKATPSNVNQGVSEPIQKEVVESKEVLNPETSELKLADMPPPTARPETSIEKLSNSINELVKNRAQFDFLNGTEPRDNFVLFLQKYYGLDDNPALGDALIENLLHKEVEWAVKVVDIIPSPDTSKKAFIIFEATNPICEEGSCPESFDAIGTAGYSSIEGIPSIVKKGDFIHIRGRMHKFKVKEGQPELPLRRLMFIAVEVTKYNRDG